MVESKTHRNAARAEATLDAVFHALGDATRRGMLHRLAEGERTVGQLADPLDMSLAAASKHVKALEAAGLIAREIRGRTHVCRLQPEPLAGAHAWLQAYERFWTTRLDRLDALLRAERAATTPPPARAASRSASPTPTATTTATPTTRRKAARSTR